MRASAPTLGSPWEPVAAVLCLLAGAWLVLAPFAMPEALSASAWREIALGLGLGWSSAVAVVSRRGLIWPGVLAAAVGCWLLLSGLALALPDVATTNRIATGAIVAIAGGLAGHLSEGMSRGDLKDLGDELDAGSAR